MLLLLPPSETKRQGGSYPSISQVTPSFSGLMESRDQLIDALQLVSQNGELGSKLLKLSPKRLGELQVNLEIRDAATLPALERYSGVLYSAIEYETLDDAAIRRARDTVLIQSALFGLISAADLIPNYRFSVSTKLPGIAAKAHWAKATVAVFDRLRDYPLIDLRSKQYAELSPIPGNLESYEVEVLTESPDGTMRPLNHFNKKAKGQFVRQFLTAKDEPKTIADLISVAAYIGMKLENHGRQLRLVTPEAF